jgi:methionyl-tRNA formyltransferase
MQAQNWTPLNGVAELRCASHLRAKFDNRARVAVFGSFMGGYHILSELLFGELAHRVKVVGVATDDPTQSFTNSKVRLWKYPHKQDDETLVRRFAAAQGLATFTGNVKSPEFHALIREDWRPDLVLMATYGQKIPSQIIALPRLGFFNFHHSGPAWPSYPGPDPIAAMVNDGCKDLVLTMHTVTDVIDGGEFVARSHRVPIPEGVNAIQMHRITWPQMGRFIHKATSDILDADSGREKSDSTWIMQEDAVGYFVDAPKPDQIRARHSGGHFMAGLRA